MSRTFNFLKITQQLEAGLPESVDRQWLDESYQTPNQFGQDLFNYYSAQFTPIPKSRPFEQYDFYYDIVIRNLQSDRIAFRWYEEGRGWQSLSFPQLHQAVMDEAGQWLNKGVVPGQTVCMLLPMQARLLVVLLTALRLRLTISVLPPYGDMFLAKRLKLLAPDHIVTDRIYTPLLKGYEKLLLDKQPEEAQEHPEVSSLYPSGTVFGSLFSPLSKNSHVPRPLSCDDAYLCALRDGVLLLDLKPGDHLAAPGLHLLQYQPLLLLATLLAGATYIHLEPEQIARQPELLAQFPIQALGVSSELRDLLLASGKKIQHSWSYWFRNPLEPLAWNRWDSWIRAMGLEKVATGNILYHAAAGGSLMFSRQTTGHIGLEAWPAPGRPWQLLDLNRSGKPAHANSGIFAGADLEADKTPLGSWILSRSDKDWLYVGTLEPRRCGRTMPTAEILETLQKLTFIRQAALIGLATGQEAQQGQFILLIFLGAAPENMAERQNEWSDQIRSQIGFHLAPEFLPDRIEFYPLYAREKAGNVDTAWCLSQYLTGGLYRKSQLLLYRMLTKLRSLGTM